VPKVVFLVTKNLCFFSFLGSAGCGSGWVVGQDFLHGMGWGGLKPVGGLDPCPSLR